MTDGRSFELIEFDHGPGGRLYSIHFKGEELDELAKFLTREENTTCQQEERTNCTYRPCRAYCHRPLYFSKVYQALRVSVEEHGFDSSFFSYTRKYGPPLVPIRFEMYRLYGLRYGRDVFIAGGGGVKLVRSIQDSATLKDAYESVRFVRDRLSERLAMVSGGDLPTDESGRRYLSRELRKF